MTVPVHDLASLEAVLGYRFQDRTILLRAVTHRSLFISGQPATHNETLEFLGDAILGFLTSEYLVAYNPTFAEGVLSQRKATLVSASHLHTTAQRLQLGAYLVMARGEEQTGGRSKPALLANAVEAIIAAIYLDGGMDAARCFVLACVLHDAENWHPAESTRNADPKTALQEWAQREKLPPPAYRVLQETGPEHERMYTVEVSVPGGGTATGVGRSKKLAGRKAAEGLLGTACNSSLL